jgi:hypothetical protein
MEALSRGGCSWPESDPTTRGGRRVPPQAGRHRPAPLLWCSQGLMATRTVERGDMLELQGLTGRCGDLITFNDLSFTVAEG